MTDEERRLFRDVLTQIAECNNALCAMAERGINIGAYGHAAMEDNEELTARIARVLREETLKRAEKAPSA